MNRVAARAALACAPVSSDAAIPQPKSRAIALVAALVCLAAALLPVDGVRAAPVTYAFSATGTPSGGALFAGLDPALFAGLPVSGSFVYDDSAPMLVPGDIVTYRGFTPQSVSGFVTALSSLSGQTGARTFADVAGEVQVGDGHSPGGPSDFLQLVFDPFVRLSAPSPHNLTSSGFDIAGYSLLNVRMLFTAGADTPDDFLSSPALPATLPAFHGRLAFDFALPSENQASAFVFIDNLALTPLAAVPEPEIYAMFAAGFGLLGFLARRRRASPASSMA